MANGFTHFIYNILHELYYYSPLHISDKPDFITLYFPLALLATTTLVEPERLCFLRTYMVQRIHFFACATQNHPIILRNSLIIILRHLMANKSDEVRKRIKNSCLIPEKHVTSLLCIVIRTTQSTNFSEK